MDHELLGTSVNPKPTNVTVVPPHEGPMEGVIFETIGSSTYM
jgi:hypothetical protein